MQKVTDGAPSGDGRIPSTTGEHGHWWRLTLIGAVSLALALGMLGLTWLLVRPLALLFASVVIATALSPLVVRLERRMPRVLAVVIVYLILLLLVSSLLWIVLPPLINQAQEAATDVPDLVRQARARLERVNLLGSDRLEDAVRSVVSGFGGSVLGLPVLLLSAALEIALVIVMSIYWLITVPALHQFTVSLFPAKHRGRVAALLEEIGQTVGGYVRGVAIDGAILAAVSYVGYQLIGLRFPLVLALLAGVGSLAPVIGPFVAAVPAVLVGLLESPTKGLIVLALYIGLQQLEGNVLLPNILRGQADIPPLLVVFALFAGASLGGIVGTLIAIPLAGALRVLVLRVVAPAIRNWFGAQATDDALKQKADAPPSA